MSGMKYLPLSANLIRYALQHEEGKQPDKQGFSQSPDHIYKNSGVASLYRNDAAGRLYLHDAYPDSANLGSRSFLE